MWRWAVSAACVAILVVLWPVVVERPEGRWYSYVLLCFAISQSAILSGLNIALFSLPVRELESMAKLGNVQAERVLRLRKDPSLLIATVLWGNMSMNSFISIVSGHTFAGVGSFIFAVGGTTICGEIIPQAWMVRNALRMGSFFMPVLKFYEAVFFVVAKPTAWTLDRCLGKEKVTAVSEALLVAQIRDAEGAEGSDLGKFEREVACQALITDEIPLVAICNDPSMFSVIRCDCPGRDCSKCQGFSFPSPGDAQWNSFVENVDASGEHWVIFADVMNRPLWVMDADGFVRAARRWNSNPDSSLPDPRNWCHRPVVIGESTPLGDVAQFLRKRPKPNGVPEIPRDVFLVRTASGAIRIATGTDLLSVLLESVVPDDEQGVV